MNLSVRLASVPIFGCAALALMLTALASPLTAADQDFNNPGIMEPVTSHLQGEDIRVPNTDQSVDGNAQSTIHGTPVWHKALGRKSLMGHDITKVSSPNDDLRLGLQSLLAAAQNRNTAAMKAAAEELQSILLGTTQGRIYDGFSMLNFNRGAFAEGHVPGEYKLRVAQDTGERFQNPFDPEGGEAKVWEVDINMLYYDGQIDSDTFLLKFPVEADWDDTVRVNYRIYSLVREDFSPTLVMLDRRQAMDTVQFPFKGFDAVWLAFEPGEILEVSIDYPPTGMMRGVYTWGWRDHPPRIQFLQPVLEITNAHTGKVELDPQGRSYADRNRTELTIDAIGGAAPEKKMWRVARGVIDGSADAQTVERWMTRRNLGPRGTWVEWADLLKNQTQLPDEAWDVLEAEGIPRGQFGDYQMVSVFLNNEMYGDGPFLNEIKLWDQGDTFPVKLINLDAHTHYFRNVDFGPRLNDDLLHCCGGGETSFEIMNFKGTYGIPKVAEMQWRAGWGFRPHYDVIQQQGVFSRGQDRATLKPYTSGDGGIFYGYQWSEESRGGDFRFNPPNFIIEEVDHPSEFRLKGADGEDGFVIGQFTEGFGVAQMCPDDPAGFCTNDVAPFNPNGAMNADTDGDGENDALFFPPFLRNPAQGQEGAGDIIPPTGAWRPFLWTNPFNGSLYLNPEHPGQGAWADLTYSHGRPIRVGQNITANIELPRASGQVFYQFDDLFHDNSIFSPHPVFAGFGEDEQMDAVTSFNAFQQGNLRIRGRVEPTTNGIRAQWVTLHDGPAGEDGCTGEALISGPVRQEDGFFLFRCGPNSCLSPLGVTRSSLKAPTSTVCVQSTIGGFAEFTIDR